MLVLFFMMHIKFSSFDDASEEYWGFVKLKENQWALALVFHYYDEVHIENKSRNKNGHEANSKYYILLHFDTLATMGG